ncbi:MAG TPA: hypothetical protein VEX15_20980 [Nocardioidaceae bacterium]|nr:hypothetical protein [Nocardioidaceae bacterium]
MNGTTFTDIERLARLQIHDRTSDAARHHSRRSLRRLAAQRRRRLADALAR